MRGKETIFVSYSFSVKLIVFEEKIIKDEYSAIFWHNFSQYLVNYCENCKMV